MLCDEKWYTVFKGMIGHSSNWNSVRKIQRRGGFRVSHRTVLTTDCLPKLQVQHIHFDQI